MALVVILTGALRLLNAQTQITPNFPRQDWQPTRAIYGWRYVGDKVCATCHPAEALSQPRTAMALALSPVSDSQVLRSHPSLQVRLGGYDYKVTTASGRTMYAVSDGHKSIEIPLLYALGRGDAGQTYLFSYRGSFYESQVSYFNAIQGLDLTLGRHLTHPGSLEAALGVKESKDEILRCFACHSTAAVSNSSLELDHMAPGITCEGCHGPGSGHVTAMEGGQPANLRIFNPGKLRCSDLVDFCGSCHRTALDVAGLNISGIRTVRFQPYRLFLSRCFVRSNGGVNCLTCHNPHQPLQHNEIGYDAKCVACHNSQLVGQDRMGFADTTCPVSKKNCITCHMPKYELPGSHFRFTDHDIRIVRPGEPYPG